MHWHYPAEAKSPALNAPRPDARRIGIRPGDPMHGKLTPKCLGNDSLFRGVEPRVQGGGLPPRGDQDTSRFAQNSNGLQKSLAPGAVILRVLQAPRQSGRAQPTLAPSLHMLRPKWDLARAPV